MQRGAWMRREAREKRWGESPLSMSFSLAALCSHAPLRIAPHYPNAWNHLVTRPPRQPSFGSSCNASSAEKRCVTTQKRLYAGVDSSIVPTTAINSINWKSNTLVYLYKNTLFPLFCNLQLIDTKIKPYSFMCLASFLILIISKLTTTLNLINTAKGKHLEYSKTQSLATNVSENFSYPYCWYSRFQCFLN